MQIPASLHSDFIHIASEQSIHIVGIRNTFRNRDLYIGVGFSDRDHGEFRRCPSAEIAGIVGLWADIDLKSAAHANKALPTSIESGRACLPADVHPTFLVTTGNGVHAWWLFREPLIFQTEETERPPNGYAGDGRTSSGYGRRAWDSPSTTLPDLARLLRVPGTQNCKDPKSPRPVHIFSTD